MIASVTSREVEAPTQASEPASKGEEPLFELSTLREQFTSASPGDLLRIVGRFGKELDQQIELLTAEGADVPPQQLRRIVHMLAGSASMIGAMRLAALAGRLDGMAAREEFSELFASLDELTTLIRATREAVGHAKADLEAAHS